MKVLANDGLHPSGVDVLLQNGCEVITEKVSQENLATYINSENIACVLVRSATEIRAELIDQCEGLRAIGRAGIGMDNIDVEYARDKGISVFNTPGASSNAVAELVVAQIFAHYRQLQNVRKDWEQEGAAFKEVKKKYSKGREVAGKTIGIIGMGNIGQCLAAKCLGLGMKVRYADLSQESVNIPLEIHGIDQPIQVTLERENWEEMTPNCDVVSIHVSGGLENCFDKSFFDRIKNGALLVNTSRGKLVDEEDLLESLHSGHLHGACLDVFKNEPNPDRRLFTHRQIEATPHIGASTEEAQEKIAVYLAKKVLEIKGKIR